ncbi:hypothetical protein NGF19_14590 [Streptomyces sp. RY43-2]|uniref:Integral membrane protein n=1 Tax=Streptomyces macrolidinus TaxID=2952607 RepID=A0ABT0ZEJ8_9ACTN|nr:hypothetical protein [Streptomyces macrolidinus]MCN9242004.1 hypothetical protein [Streptomyces macrolidinus]
MGGSGDKGRGPQTSRRKARVFWWLVALVVVALPLGYGLFSTHAYLSGYRTVVTDGHGPDVFAWRDPAGHTVRGPIDGVPEDGVWDEEGLGMDVTGQQIWVSAQGEAYAESPRRTDMFIGYAGTALALGLVAYVVRVGRNVRDEADAPPPGIRDGHRFR